VSEVNCIKTQLFKTVVKYSFTDVIIILFTNKGIFIVITLKSPQNDQPHAPAATQKKDTAAKLCCTQIMLITFSQLLMVSVGETKYGYGSLISVNPGVKVGGASYHNELQL